MIVIEQQKHWKPKKKIHITNTFRCHTGLKCADDKFAVNIESPAILSKKYLKSKVDANLNTVETMDKAGVREREITIS